MPAQIVYDVSIQYNIYMGVSCVRLYIMLIWAYLGIICVRLVSYTVRGEAL